MTKDQERKVAAKQLLCARYTTKIQERLRAIFVALGLGRVSALFCLPMGEFWALSKTEKRKQDDEQGT